MSAPDFIEDKRTEGEARAAELKRALEEQLKQTTSAEHALPIERLMDRLAAQQSLAPEEYASLSKEIHGIQERNHDHLARLEKLIDTLPQSNEAL